MVWISLLLSLAQPDPQALIPLYRDNATRCERELGPAHADTRRARLDLGLYLAKHGSRAEAITLLRQAAESAEDLAQLAELVPETEAPPYLRRALAAEEQARGPEHPKVAVRLNNLALVLPAARAEPLLRRALAINLKHLGEAHPESGVTLNNLADNLATQRRYREAAPLAQRAVASLTQSLGAGNDRTQAAAANLKGIQAALKAAPR
jgi:hypothetical protein